MGRVAGSVVGRLLACSTCAKLAAAHVVAAQNAKHLEKTLVRIAVLV
jgi:hypothetical protein